MNETREADDVRTRVLDAAEHLFGSQGLQASIREITAAANANLAAVNYHFKSKENLIAAVLARKAGPINAERLKQLDELEAGAERGAVPVDKILRAFLAPTREVMESNPQFLRLAGRLILEPSETVRKVMSAQFGEVARRFHRALCRSLHPLAPQEVWIRLGFVVGSVAYVWANGTELIALFGGMGTRPSPEEVIERLVEYGAAGMRGAVEKGQPS
jgi:AcrR family transcriptional regulator